MNEYEQKQADRAGRLRARADKLKTESDRRFGQAREAIAGIPPGQPILVGHHSERRHRRDLDKHDRNMRAGIDAGKQAAELERRADAVGKGGISSDDPDAPDKIRERIAALEASQELMKASNKAWRQAKRPRPDDIDGWSKAALILAGLVPEMTTEQAIKRCNQMRLYMAHDFMERAPFTYQLQNNGGNIKRLKARLADIEAKRQLAHKEERIDDCVVIEDPEANRLRMVFDHKPGPNTRAALRARGFRWSKREGAWQRHLSEAARWAAAHVLETVHKPETEQD